MAMETQPKERPILMHGRSVRAILDGRKWQTRRPVKDPATLELIGDWADSGCDPIPGDPKPDGMRVQPTNAGFMCKTYEGAEPALFCPYGRPGETVWVREAWTKTLHDFGAGPILYRADYLAGCPAEEIGGDYWRPSIHMPRHFSRLTLEITDVRVERLQEIDEEDIEAEGVDTSMTPDERRAFAMGGSAMFGPDRMRNRFARNWNGIHGNGPYAWKHNPWVWVIEFRTLQ